MRFDFLRRRRRRPALADSALFGLVLVAATTFASCATPQRVERAEVVYFYLPG